MEKELLYWVFSTIVQAFVALLALVGMVGIYWFGKLKEGLNKIEDDLRQMYDICLQDAEPLPLIINKEFIKAIKGKKIPSLHSKEDIDAFQALTANFICNYEEEQKFKRYFIVFAIITIIDIIASLILLRYTIMLAEVQYISLIIGIVIFLSISSLILAIYLIIRAIMPELFAEGIKKLLSNNPS